MDDELIEKVKSTAIDKKNRTTVYDVGVHNESGVGGVKPIYDVTDKKIMSDLELNKIATQIKKSGNSLGWKMEELSNGMILGRIALRTHVATIKINYNSQHYNINYLSSSNLKYDKSEYFIHQNYNRWIKILEKRIDNYLTSL